MRAYHGAASSSRGPVPAVSAVPAPAAAMTVTRPPSDGRLSCHHTSPPAMDGNATDIAPRATSAALMGDSQVPYGAMFVMVLPDITSGRRGEHPPLS